MKRYVCAVICAALAPGFIFPAPSAANDPGGFGIDMSNAGNSAVPVPPAPARQAEQPKAKADAPPEPVIRGDADLALFFRRLESIGLDTREIRGVTSKIKIYFKAPNSAAEAEYGFILNRLYIPDTFKEPGSNRVRFNLAANELNTMIHEYTHAARDVSASETAPSGTPARIHYNSVKYIWADLYNDPDGSGRYAWMRADEVSSYFMGAACMKLFWAVDDIIMYNKYFGGGDAASVEEAKRLGGKLLLPTPETAKLPWEKGFLDRYKTLGQNRVYDSAMFKSSSITSSKLIHWKEAGREWLKTDMYKNILGLNPPGDINKLVDRLNTLDNDWIRDVREETAKIRLENAKKAEQGK
ncbi:MAG: hypothetical protein KKH28_02025 [Elusimicrobia bacterium]|nr:hypothetical protein [Elusimicrobiota bacterium]